ncbi:AAA family ATPase [Streptomyces sp. NPDC003717]|uniref:helix-turn-helix transcriptional regulator n=1 Tax=Streptomyces sp. NPDC003717 TaxID=3154276 RepID=UPI00339F186A
MERTEELAALRDAFEGSAHTRGSVVVLSGAVATGKSALLQAWGEQLCDIGALLLTASACRAERELPLGVLEQLLRSPGLPTASAERALAHLAAQDGPVLTAPALRGLCDVLRGLAEERPVVVAVDDAHHADAASLRCLLYLVRRLRSGRLHVVLTECAQQKAANALLGSEFPHEPGLRQIRLEPLSKAGVAELLAGDLGASAARDLTPEVHAMSAGYPLLARALIDDHRTGNGPGEAYGRAVLGFLHRHGTAATRVARVTAVLGEHTSPAPLARLLDADAESVARVVQRLTVAEVLHEGRLCHPAFRAAVLDGIPSDERRALHGRVAQTLYEEGAPATEVAAQLVAADRTEVPWAVPVLREAAHLLLADDEVETGVDHLRAALRRCGDAEQRGAVVGALADAEWRLDPAKVLRHLPAAPTAAGDGLPPLPAHLLWHGRVAEGLDAIGTLIGPGAAGAAPVNAADLDTPWLWGAYLYPGHVKERLGSGVLPAPRGTAPPAVTPELQGAGVLMNDLLYGGEDEATAAAERSLNRYRLGPRTVAVQTAALAALTYRDRPHRAAAWCNRLIAQAAERRSPTWQALFTAERALIHLRQGDPAGAARRAEDALALLGPKSWGVVIGLPLAAAVAAKAALGDVDGAAELLERPVPQAVFETRVGLHYLAARGRYHLSTGCYYAALCDFYAVGKRMSGWGVDLPGVEPWRLGAAEAYLALGESLLARQLVEAQLALPMPARGRTHGMTLRVRAATHEPPTRVGLLEEAVSVLQECGDAFELARAVADLSAALRAEGESERAGLLARKARLLSRRVGGAPASADDPSDEAYLPDAVAEQPAPPGPDAGLTGAEVRVARLAADGLTNHEISRKLCITVSTVEQHLTRIYRKFHIKRMDLRAVLQ